MMEFHYQGRVGSTKRCVDLVNLFLWDLTISENNGQWIVLSGEKLVLSTESRETVDAFLYGMALAYSAMPQSYVEKYQQERQPQQ